VWRQKDRQIPSMAAMIVVFFLFWNFLAHMIFALFLGNATLTNVSSSLQVFLTPEGLAMLAVGTAVGAVFAAVLFALTVVSLPMLMDREVDFVTAMLASWTLVTRKPGGDAGLGVLIAAGLFAGDAAGLSGAVRRAAGVRPCQLAPLSPRAGVAARNASGAPRAPGRAAACSVVDGRIRRRRRCRRPDRRQRRPASAAGSRR
jgi:hypothetical protein